MTALPITPDFDVWSVELQVQDLDVSAEALTIIWSDGQKSAHHALLLRENSTDPRTTHIKTREMAIGPEEIAENLCISDANLRASGAISVTIL